MQKIAWMTDIHLNFLKRPEVVAFCRDVAGMNPDAVLLGGDIGDARTIKTYLEIFQDVLDCPIYFLLGNHDFYHGSIAEVREQIKKLSTGSRLLHWLPEVGIVPLAEKTCLLGCESWADGRLGDYAKSKVMLNDYFLIDELTGLDSRDRLKRLKSLADDAAAGLSEILPKALDRFQTVILLTHVPPFTEACRYQGQKTSAEWLPHFSCKAAGDVIMKHMSNYPNREMLVLCGHTHDAFQIRIRTNVEVRVGGAVYGMPRIQGLLNMMVS